MLEQDHHASSGATGERKRVERISCSGAAAASERPAPLRGATVAAALAVLLAAWCAAGSLGLIAQPLRLSLMYASLVLAATLAPRRGGFRRQLGWLLPVALLIAMRAVLIVSTIHDLLIVTAAAAGLALGSGGRQRQALRASALAVLGLTLFHALSRSAGSMWLLNDLVAATLGRVAGALSGAPLEIGPSFAGLDYLVLMGGLIVAWTAATAGRGPGRAIAAVVAVGGAHFLYLAILAHTADLADLLPASVPPVFDHPYVPPAWSWSDAIRRWLPWNLPVIAAGLHLAVAGIMFRWARWSPAASPEPINSRESPDSIESPACPTRGSRLPREWIIAAAASLAAVGLSLGATFDAARSDLSGKRLLANQFGNLDWELPTHDHYGQAAAGWCGMLPRLVESLGGELRLSEDFTAAELSQADAVLLIHPLASMPEPVKQRLADFVHRGGSLLVVAEPYRQQGDVQSGSDEILAQTRVHVRRDVAISAAGGWVYSAQWLQHPTTAGLEPRLGPFTTDAGASLAVAWPAQPLVLGQWGWSDPGSDAALTGVSRWETGERMGDLVLAAEQAVGAGRVLVLGDVFALTNEGGVRAYGYTGRLLTYLANKGASPQSPWRQAVTALLGVGLLAAVAVRPEPRRLLIVAIVWAVSQTACEAFGRHASRVVPDGRRVGSIATAADRPSADRSSAQVASDVGNLAYIDASHVPAYSDGQWGFRGINGLALTLMRSGYLTLSLPEYGGDRLDRAALVLSIAPARRFSRAERRRLVEFVHRGGTFCCLVGAEESAPSAALLADFGIRVPTSPVPTSGRWHEPEPLGHVRPTYGDAGADGSAERRPAVQFYAAWPVASDAIDADVLVRAPQGQPVVVSRRVGRGRIVVIGDSAFALNQNLEYVTGEPFDGRYDNAHFWRWLLGQVTDRPRWAPPVPAAPDGDAEGPATDGSATDETDAASP